MLDYSKRKLLLTGERAAISGYKGQYDEFARKVYDCILNNELVEIRVADTVDNVGKLDDICYVTHNEVHAYQVKWTMVESSFGFSDFVELFPSLVDGWKKLCELYPNKIVVPHLLTNRKSTTRGRYIQDYNGKKIGAFSAFRREVIDILHNGNVVDAKWENIVNDLKTKTKEIVTEEEFYSFWRVFDLVTDYADTTIKIADAKADQKINDLWMIVNLIIEMAASKELLVVMSYDEILNQLGWSSRINTIFNHNLSVDSITYEPIQVAFQRLNDLLRSKTKGYIFVEGTPGSGKSTLLTQWTYSLPNPSVRYYAFDFTDPSSQFKNDSFRGERLTFLYDIVILLEKYGLGKSDTLPYRDEVFLKNRFYDLLQEIGRKFQETKLCTIVVVDGLDHIKREYSTHTATLMNVLPSPSDLPDGIVFVLGSQYYTGIGLNKYIEYEYTQGQSTITMSPFSVEELQNLVRRQLGENNATPELLKVLAEKSKGHPLYIRYMLNLLLENPTLNIEMIPAYNDNIEVYYSNIIGHWLKNSAMRNFLAILSRVVGDIKIDFLYEWQISEQVVLDFESQMRHLFVLNKHTKTLSFFHNSFRQYLLYQTAIDSFTNSYDEQLDKRYYKKLAEFVANSKAENYWNVGTYLYKAGEYDEFIKLLTPECIIEQIHYFRPLWHVQRDIEYAAQIAAKNEDPYLMACICLLKSGVDQMKMQDYNASILIKDFLQLGISDLAKCQIRDGHILKCSQEYAMQLARYFYHNNDFKEANILFDLSYPEFLTRSTKNNHKHYRIIEDYIESLKEWVYTAIYFQAAEHVEQKIDLFITYLRELAAEDDNDIDEEKIQLILRSQIIKSLIELQRWHELDDYLVRFCSKGCEMQFMAQLDKVYKLLDCKSDTDEIQTEYDKLRQIANLSSISNSKFLDMAYLAMRTNAGLDVVKFYLDQVSWNELDDFTAQVMLNEDFDKLSSRIRYIILRRYVGYDDILTDLISIDKSDEDGEILANYLKMVYYLATLIGDRRKGIDREVEFLLVVKPYLLFFNQCIGCHRNKYAYSISKHQSDFYEFLVYVASQCGNTTISKMGNIVTDIFVTNVWKADTDCMRQLICALYRNGISRGWCEEMLIALEKIMFEYKNIDARQREALLHGRAWLLLNNKERTTTWFQRMIVETLGVGYRKDYQPTTMAKWIGDVNKIDSTHAVERIHWMTSRLRHINDSCESGIAIDAARKLLSDALELNLSVGLNLAMWLLDAEIGYFAMVSFCLINNLLKKTHIEAEYKPIFRYFTQVHLYVVGTTSYELSTELLELIYNVGKKILGKNYTAYVNELKRCLSTQCVDRIGEKMLEKLDELEKSDSINDGAFETSKNGKLDTYSRKSDELVSQAKEFLKKGNREKAWKIAQEALYTSNVYGWARYADGGTRINSCQLLIDIDNVNGRKIAMQQLADDISAGIGYDLMQNLDEIINLLSDKIDILKLYEHKVMYMSWMLRDDCSRKEDKPLLIVDEISIQDAISRWLIYIMKMPIICISERAKILLAYLIADGFQDGVCYMNEDNCDVRDILEVGMYVQELNCEALSNFQCVAMEYAKSTNYLFRLYAQTILTKLGISLPDIEKTQLPLTYRLSLPITNFPELHTHSLAEGYVNWDNPISVMSIGSHILSYLSICSGINKINIATRAYDLVKKKGNIADWDESAENAVANHYDSIGLRYPWRRLRANAVWEGLMETAGELLDGGAIHGRYNNTFFIVNDFSSITLQEQAKPKFIHRITDENAWSVPENWEYGAEKIERLNGELSKISDMFVIGESTHLYKFGDKRGIEEFSMKVSLKSQKYSKENFFGDIPYQCSNSLYYNLIDIDIEIIVKRDGYFIANRNKQVWIAFNPIIATILGWKPSEEGYFAWVDEDGNKMVESIFWQMGNIYDCNRSNAETGEGWYVLMSSKALDELMAYGGLFVHQLVERWIGEQYANPISTGYKMKKMTMKMRKDLYD